MKRKLILETLRDIHREYSERLYDFMQVEAQAQLKLFNALERRVEGEIQILSNSSQKYGNPIPNKVMKGSRVRLEVPLEKQEYNIVRKRRHDICIVEDGAQTIDKNTIEIIIEVKHGYGYEPAQVNKVKSIGKDYSVLNYYSQSNTKPDAFLVYFLGNSYAEQLERYGEQIEIYKDEIKKFVQDENIRKNNIFLVFTDEIRNGNLGVAE